MDFTSVLQRSEPHQRTIVHLDMDCYYAQVEEIRDPKLRTLPMGIKQKNSVVTCNYVARAAGVRKMTLIEDALEICPELVLINGEDLTPYRQMSQRIYDILLNYTPAVEKLGFDENFMDVSALVEQRLQTQKANHTLPSNVVGHIHPENKSLEECNCGCAERLIIGSQIAAEVREELQLRLGMTCCAGVAYNKLLAKLVGGQHKPNQQTVLVSIYAEEFMRSLNELRCITGIGTKTQQLLLEMGVSTVSELQESDMDVLRKKFGFETAKKLKDLAYGRDASAVRASGKHPKSIGLEDSTKPMSVRADVEERFKMLLRRLMEQVADDGRIPIVLKIVLRKYDMQKKCSHRESKQANILPSLFLTDAKSGKVMLAEGALEKLLKIIMRLFERVVDLDKPFNITLIGLAFSKFQQRRTGSASIANFLIKKTDLEVQSITSLTNTNTHCSSALPATSHSPTPSMCSNTSGDEAAFRSSPTTFQPSDQFYRRRAATASPIPMLVDNGSESGATNSDFSDFSETEVEPSPKKSRISRLLMHKRPGLASTSNTLSAGEVASPSKLRVGDLRLSPRDGEQPASSGSGGLQLSPLASGFNIQSQRFHTLQPSSHVISRHTTRQMSTTSSMSSSANSSPVPSPLPSPMDESNFTTSTTTTSTKLNTNVPLPSSVDPQVFNELPVDVQNELIANWRNNLAVASSSVGVSGEVATTQASTNNPTSSTVTSTAVNVSQKNTLYRYFLRNK